MVLIYTNYIILSKKLVLLYEQNPMTFVGIERKKTHLPLLSA